MIGIQSRGASADVDLTGTWNIDIGSGTSTCSGATFTQSSLTLTISGSCSLLGSVNLTGGINPVSGAFNLAGTSSSVCAGVSMIGTSAPDGNSISGSANCGGFGDFDFTGTRVPVVSPSPSPSPSPTPDPTPCATALTSVTPTPAPTLPGGATVSPTATPANQTPAPGNPPQCLGPIKVPAQAVVGGTGTGTALNFECAWIAPDMTPNDASQNYGTVGHRDDTPWVTADGPACDPSAFANTDPEQARHHMVGIVPNAENLPVERGYEKWVAVEAADVSSIVDVYFKVWEPFIEVPPNGPNCGPDLVVDGTTYPSERPNDPVEIFPTGPGTSAAFCLEEQVHATGTQAPPTAQNPLQKVPCTELQSSSSTNMFAQAVENGAMTQAEVDNMINKCFEGAKAIFKVPDLLTKDKPCGEVRVEATAVNSSGTAYHLPLFFDNICFIHLQLDFTSLDWGTINTNGGANIPGDTTFDPPGVACPTAPVGCVGPTVLNTGNAEMVIVTQFDPLILASDPTKTITSFDSKFRPAWLTNPASIEVADPQPAGQEYCFGNPVGHDQTGKIDFSVHPVNAQAGTYTGAVYITARFYCLREMDGNEG